MSPRATWKYLEPKDWLNFDLTGVAAATYDSIVLHWLTDNRDPARVDYDAVAARDWPGSTAPSCPTSSPATTRGR